MSRRSSSSTMERKSSSAYSRPTSAASPMSYRTSTPTRPQSAAAASAAESPIAASKLSTTTAQTPPCNFRYAGCYLLIIISDGCDQLRQQSWLKHWLMNPDMDQRGWKEFNENWFNGFTAKVIQQVNKGLSSWNYTGTEQDLKIFEAFLRNQATGKSDQSEENPKNSNETEAHDNGVNQGQILLQYAQQSLAIEVLCNPSLLILCQCLKNVLRSPTGSIQIIYSGATFAETGSWILADGVFSAYNLYELIAQAEPKNSCSSSSDGPEQNPCSGHGSIAEHLSLHDVDLQLHTQPSGEWAALKEMAEMNRFLFRFTLNMEPRPDLITTLAMQTQVTLLNHISDRLDGHYQWLLEGSDDGLASIINQHDPFDAVGFIRLEHPTLYVVPSGQGDCALLSLDGGFTMLWDGGYLPAQRSFWPFVKHLRRLDSVVATHLGEDNFFGLTSFLALKLIRKQFQTPLAEYPRIGFLFCNDHLTDTDYTDSDHNQSNPLVDDHIISLKELSKQFFQLLKQLNIDPLPCIGDIDSLKTDSKVGIDGRKPTSFAAGSSGSGRPVKKDSSPRTPITLYHKVGVGTLYMYVLNPTVHRMVSKTDHGGGGSSGRSTPQSTIHNDPKNEAGNRIPEADQQSICSLLIWRPHNPADRVLRILLPSNCTQAQILDGLQSLMIVSKFDQTSSATAPAASSGGHVSRRYMPTRKQLGMAATAAIPQDFDDSKLIELLELDVLLHQNTVCTGEMIEKGLKDRYEKVIPGLMMGKTSSLHQYARSLSMAPTLIRSEKSRKLNTLNRRGKSVAPASGRHVERAERPDTPSRYSRFRSVSPPNTKTGSGQKIASVVSSFEKRFASKPGKIVQQDKPTTASIGGDRGKHLPPLPPKKTKTVTGVGSVPVAKTVVKAASGTMDGKHTIAKAAVDDGMRKTVMEQVRAINKRKVEPIKPPQTLQSKKEPTEVNERPPPVQTGNEKIDDVEIIEHPDVIKPQPPRPETSDSNKEELSEETSIRSPTDDEVRGITRRIEQQEKQEAMIRAAAAALITDEIEMEPRIGDAEWRPVKPGLGSKSPLSVDIGKISSEIDYETDPDQLDSLNLNDIDRNGPVEIDQPVINKDVGVGDNESINQPELYFHQPEEKPEPDGSDLEKSKEIDTSIHQAPVDMDEAKKVAEEATSAVKLAAIEKIEKNPMKPQPEIETITPTVSRTVQAEKPQGEDQMEPTIQIEDNVVASAPVLPDGKIDEVEEKDKVSETNQVYPGMEEEKEEEATPTSIPDGKSDEESAKKSESETGKESAPAAMLQIDGNEKIDLDQVEAELEETDKTIPKIVANIKDESELEIEKKMFQTEPKLEIEEEPEKIPPDSPSKTQISIDKVETSEIISSEPEKEQAKAELESEDVKTDEQAEELKPQVKPMAQNDEYNNEQATSKLAIEESTSSVPEKEQIQDEKVESEQNIATKQVAESTDDMKPEPKDEETKLMTKNEEKVEGKAEPGLEIEDSGPSITPTIVADKVDEDQATEKTPAIVSKAIVDDDFDENRVQSVPEIEKSIPETDLMAETDQKKDEEASPESIPEKDENLREKMEPKLETVAEMPTISKAEQIDSEETKTEAPLKNQEEKVEQDDQVEVETQPEMTKTTPTPLSLAEEIANVEGKQEPELGGSLAEAATKPPESKPEQESEPVVLTSSVVPIEDDQKIDSIEDKPDMKAEDDLIQDADVKKPITFDTVHEQKIVPEPATEKSTSEQQPMVEEKIIPQKPEEITTEIAPEEPVNNEKIVSPAAGKEIVSGESESKPEIMETPLPVPVLEDKDEKKIDADIVVPGVKFEKPSAETIPSGQDEHPVQPELTETIASIDSNDEEKKIEANLAEPEVKIDGAIDQTIPDGKIDVEQIEPDSKTEVKTLATVVDDNLDKIQVESESNAASTLPKEQVKGEEVETAEQTATTGDDQIDTEEQADQDFASESISDQVKTTLATANYENMQEKIKPKLETEAPISKSEQIDPDESDKSSKTEETLKKQEPEGEKVEILKEVDEKVKVEPQPESTDAKTENIEGKSANEIEESLSTANETIAEKDEEEVKRSAVGEEEKFEDKVDQGPETEEIIEESALKPDAEVVVPMVKDDKNEAKLKPEIPTTTDAPVEQNKSEESKSDSIILAAVGDQVKPDVDTTKPPPETVDSGVKNDTVDDEVTSKLDIETAAATSSSSSPIMAEKIDSTIENESKNVPKTSETLIDEEPEPEVVELLIEIDENEELTVKTQDEIAPNEEEKVDKVKVEPKMETTQETPTIMQEIGLEIGESVTTIDSPAKVEHVNDEQIKPESVMEKVTPTGTIKDESKPEVELEKQAETGEITPTKVEQSKQDIVEPEFGTEESGLQISLLISTVIEEIIQLEPALEETTLQVISTEKDDMIDHVEGKTAPENENTLKTSVDSIEQKIDLEPKAAETPKGEQIITVPIEKDSDRDMVKPGLVTVAETLEEIQHSAPVMEPMVQKIEPKLETLSDPAKSEIEEKHDPPTEENVDADVGQDGENDRKIEPDLEPAEIAMETADRSEAVDEVLIRNASIVAEAVVLAGENSTGTNFVPTTADAVILNLQQQCQNFLGQTNQLLEDMDQKISQVTHRLFSVNSPDISNNFTLPTLPPEDTGESDANVVAIEETVNQTVVNLPPGAAADIEFQCQTTVLDGGSFEAQQQVTVSSVMQTFVEGNLDIHRAAGHGGDDDNGSKDLIEPSSDIGEHDSDRKQTKELLKGEISSLLEPKSEHDDRQQQQPSAQMQSTYDTSFDPLLDSDSDQRLTDDVKDQTDDNNNCIESKQEQIRHDSTTTTVLTTDFQLITTSGGTHDVPVLPSGIQFQTLTTTIQSITQPIFTAQTGEQVSSLVDSFALSSGQGATSGGGQTEELIGSEFTIGERAESSNMTITTTASSSSSGTNPSGMDHGAIPSVIYTMTRTSRERKFDADKDWDPPMALPSPQPPSFGKESGRNRLLGTSNNRNRSDLNPAVQSSNVQVNPVYMDLVYVPGHGKNGYCDEEFFRKIRARYYVFSAVEPNRSVFDALLNGVAQWKNNDWLDNSVSSGNVDGKRSNKVTIVPTYESEALAQWSVENRSRMEQLGVEVVSAANRCWISLNDDDDDDRHSYSTKDHPKDICFSYKIEF